MTAKLKKFCEMSDNFFMGHVEIRFLVISTIHNYTNLPMTVAYINSYRDTNFIPSNSLNNLKNNVSIYNSLMMTSGFFV